MKTLNDWAFNGVALLSCGLMLAACGGGGGSGSGATQQTAITGFAVPFQVNSHLGYGFLDMLIGANSSQSAAMVQQNMIYTFDPAAAAAAPAQLKVASLYMNPAETQTTSYMQITTGGAYLSDPALGQASSVTLYTPAIATTTFAVGGAYVASQVASGVAGLPTSTIALSGVPAGEFAFGYVLPYSLALNPAGYVYQTFGTWGSWIVNTPQMWEYYFSAGIVNNPATLPVSGVASYTGHAGGSPVDAITRDPSDSIATVNATVDFATRTITISTTGTTTKSGNAAAGAPHTANPSLNLSGTLTFAAGRNTFTGAVSSVNGMTGSVTGRFYGAGISAVTPTKVLGSPPEIGGTFAVMKAGLGAMQGAFGAK